MNAFLAAVLFLTALPRAAGSQTAPADAASALFDDSVVHEISLTISSRDWASLKKHFHENTYYPCDFRWGDQTVRNVGIRSRGTGSRSGTKPGLRVDFNRYVGDQKFLGLKSVVLRNNTQDPSNMREFMSMKFFRHMGINAPREAFARLYINNEYAGLYTIVESVDEASLASNFGEDSGYLYEYDFDEDNRTPYVWEYLGSNPANSVPSPFKPETHESDPNAEYVEQLIWTMNEAGDAVWCDAMSEYLELDRFVRHLAIENFLAEEDGLTGDYGPNNFYIYRFDNRKLFRLILWDKSNAFWTNDYSIFRNITSGPPERRNRFVLRAFTHSDVLNLYLDTLLEASDAAVEGATPDGSRPGWLERQAIVAYGLIADAARSDPVKPFTNAEFEADVVNVTNFSRLRSEAVRQMVAASEARLKSSRYTRSAAGQWSGSAPNCGGFSRRSDA